MIYQFNGRRNMKSIGDHHFRMILIYFNYNRFIVNKGIDLLSIYNGPYSQEAE